MAQKIEFVKAGSLPTLAAKFDEVLAQYSDDNRREDGRYIVTPIGFAVDIQGYVLAVRVEATHKTRWEEPGVKTHFRPIQNRR